MQFLLTIVLLLVLFFRWSIFERLVGTKRMYLIDAVMFTYFAAVNFAQPSGWLSYLVATMCAILTIYSGVKYLVLDSKGSPPNEKQSDSR